MRAGTAGDVTPAPSMGVSLAAAPRETAVPMSRRLVIGLFIAACLVFPTSLHGASFVQTDRLPVFQGNADYGGSTVAVLGETAVACAPLRNAAAEDSGECIAYEWTGSSWFPAHLLAPSEPVGDGRFGHSLDMTEDRIVIGAPTSCCPSPTNPGQVFVFRRTDDGWEEETILVPADGQDDDFFGAAVAIDGPVIAVGAPGQNSGVV